MIADLIRATVKFVMSNYSLSFFVVGLIASLVAIERSTHRMDRSLVVEKLLAWYVFFSIGIDNFYNFVMHVFLGNGCTPARSGDCRAAPCRRRWSPPPSSCCRRCRA